MTIATTASRHAKSAEDLVPPRLTAMHLLIEPDLEASGLEMVHDTFHDIPVEAAVGHEHTLHRRTPPDSALRPTTPRHPSGPSAR